MGLLMNAVRIGSADRARSDLSRQMSSASTWSSCGSVPDCDSIASSAQGLVHSQALHEFFQGEDVQRWQAGCFRMERPARLASKKSGSVEDHMVDARTGAHVSVTCVPNEWIRECHELFAAERPDEVKRPWVDIGCAAFLTEMGFPYARPLFGVYRDDSFTRVVTELAPEGDLLGWLCTLKEAPGVAREALVRPIAQQLVDAVRLLHELSIVHRGLSAETVALSRQGHGGAFLVQLKNFGTAARTRYVRGGCGVPASRAPEAHSGEAHDGFLADGFAVGVLIFGLLVGERPWASTAPGGCRAFEFCRKQGFAAVAARRKCFGRAQRVAECLSGPALRLLEGLLAVDPAQRLSLGEDALFAGGERASVLEESWLQA